MPATKHEKQDFDPDCRNYQKSSIADNPIKVCPSGVFSPSDVLITSFERPGCRAESQSAQDTINRALNQISDLSATQRATAKIMVMVHKCEPDLGLLRIAAGNRLNGDLTQFRKRTFDINNIRNNRRIFIPLKIVRIINRWQFQDTTMVQLGQCLAATHVLEPAVIGPPVEPMTYPPRQLAA